MSQRTFKPVKIDEHGNAVNVSIKELIPDHNGYLLIQDGAFNSWKKRYFVLQNNGLYFFESQKAEEMLGVFILMPNTKINRDPAFVGKTKSVKVINSLANIFSGEKNDLFLFEMNLEVRVFGKRKTKNILFSAGDEKAKEKWINAIDKELGRNAYVSYQRAITRKSLNFDYSNEQIVSDKRFIDSYFGEHLGSMVFDTKPIPMYPDPETEFPTEFNKGNEIYTRFSFEHSIRNYRSIDQLNINFYEHLPTQITVGNKITHKLFLQLYLQVDGKFITTPKEPFKLGFSHIEYKSKGLSTLDDIYEYCQSVALPIYSENRQFSSNLEGGRLIFKQVLDNLPPGKHRFKFTVLFSLVPTEKNLQKSGVQPLTTTDQMLLSTGEFDLVVSDTVLLSDEEKMNYKNLTSVLYKQFETSPDWGKKPIKKETPEMIIIRDIWKPEIGTSKYSIIFDAYFYRDPLSGWDKESFVHYRMKGIYDGTPKPPYEITSYVSKLHKEIENVDNLVYKYGIRIKKRCPKILRIDSRNCKRDFTNKELESMYQKFQAIDKDASGHLDKEEMGDFFIEHNIPYNIGIVFFYVFRRDDKGISFEEFCQFNHFMEMADKDRFYPVRAIFEKYSNKEDKIDHQQLLKIVSIFDDDIYEDKTRLTNKIVQFGDGSGFYSFNMVKKILVKEAEFVNDGE